MQIFSSISMSINRSGFYHLVPPGKETKILFSNPGYCDAIVFLHPKNVWLSEMLYPIRNL